MFDRVLQYISPCANMSSLFVFSAYPGVMSRIVGSGEVLYEPANLKDLAALTGMPAKQQARTVLIAPRPLKTLQSGRKYAHQWQITWKAQQKWKNPLMGWISSADPMSNVKACANYRA